jgi:hypothetical protein
MPILPEPKRACDSTNRIPIVSAALHISFVVSDLPVLQAKSALKGHPAQLEAQSTEICRITMFA